MTTETQLASQVSKPPKNTLDTAATLPVASMCDCGSRKSVAEGPEKSGPLPYYKDGPFAYGIRLIGRVVMKCHSEKCVGNKSDIADCDCGYFDSLRKSQNPQGECSGVSSSWVQIGQDEGVPVYSEVDMCDLTIEVLVDDCVDYLSDSIGIKDVELHEVAEDKEDYERLFKQWLKETLCNLAGKCEDMGYYRGGGREGIEDAIESRWSAYWEKAGSNIGPEGISVSDVREAFEAGAK